MKTRFLFLVVVALVFTGVEAYSQCSGKCRDGRGTYTFGPGEVYDGTFVNGKFDGYGTYTYKSGAKYVGEFKDGKRNGKGTYTYPTGDVYNGDFVNGMPEGKGIYTFANGDKFTGEFKGGKRTGRGTYVYAISGTKQTGVFENSSMIEQISLEKKEK